MYADAVAVAGLNAFESFGRRAVLLVLGSVAEDASTYRPAVVRRYLDLLRVPLFVWTLEDRPPASSPWGEVAGRDSLGLARGLRPDRESLDSQRVLWVEGRYLPQEIELAGGANGVELVH